MVLNLIVVKSIIHDAFVYLVILSMDPILKNLRKFMRLWMFVIGVSNCILGMNSTI